MVEILKNGRIHNLQGDAVKIEKLYEAIARIGSVRIQRLIPQMIAKEGTFCFMKFNFWQLFKITPFLSFYSIIVFLYAVPSSAAGNHGASRKSWNMFVILFWNKLLQYNSWFGTFHDVTVAPHVLVSNLRTIQLLIVKLIGAAWNSEN